MTAAMATDETTKSVRPESLDKAQEKLQVQRYKGQTYTRKRGKPLGSMSSKTTCEQKPVLFDSNSYISSHSKGKNDYSEPPTPMRKRGRCNMERKPLLVDNISSDDDYQPDDDYEPERKMQKKKNVPTRRPSLRRRSKPSCDDTDNEEASCGFFKIVVGDGSVIDHTLLSDDLRGKYYRLCQARKALLHKNLLKQISPTLAAGMIAETAKIADSIKATSHSSLEDLVSWKKTMDSFQRLGMDVAFIRERVDGLLCILGAPSSTMPEPEQYEELTQEKARAVKKVRDLESRLSVLKKNLKKVVEREQMLEASNKNKMDQAVRTFVTAPW